jgi:hypothetical protein
MPENQHGPQKGFRPEELEKPRALWDIQQHLLEKQLALTASSAEPQASPEPGK